MEVASARKVKLCFERSEGRRLKRYFFESDNPLRDLRLIKASCEKTVLKPAYVSTIGNLCFIVNPSAGFISTPLLFRAYPQRQRVNVVLEKEVGELWLSNVFRELRWDYEFESEEDRRLRRIRESLTDFDLQILELRSQGLSFWSISEKLNCTLTQVRHSLRKLSLLPETRQKLGEYRIMSREERYRRGESQPATS